ncbi:hypothetical protein C6496_05715 [Candidatus Poribacteria bacterium]|nr:MAG: hypothetical protein C6496_05715 [Candidatus Poribacteria bacterium]
MSEIVQKVTAFIVRERDGVRELLVFKHPTAGVQIPAGTVEKGEDIETAVKRETYEETGLRFVEIEGYLGCFENELKDNERIIAETTRVYIEPNLNAVPYKRQLPKGLTVNYLSTQEDFTRISYIEYGYDEFHRPVSIDTNITGWVPNEKMSGQKKRHFFLMSTQEETADAWELKSDLGHIFKPYWTPLFPKPQIIPPQDKWLDFVYEKI